MLEPVVERELSGVPIEIMCPIRDTYTPGVCDACLNTNRMPIPFSEFGIR